MKYDGIICCGDSFTLGMNSVRPLVSGQRWPEMLGERINLPVVNLARGGASNTEIAYQILNDLGRTFNNPLIIFAFTHSLRIPFFGNDGKIFSLFAIDEHSMQYQETKQPQQRLHLARKYFQSFALDVTYGNKNMSGLEHLTYQSLKTIQQYKNFYPNCDIVWGQIHSNFAHTLFTENVMNCLGEVGTDCFNIDNDLLPLETILQDKHRISKEDTHPNIQGMQVIADYFFNYLDKYYL